MVHDARHFQLLYKHVVASQRARRRTYKRPRKQKAVAHDGICMRSYVYVGMCGGVYVRLCTRVAFNPKASSVNERASAHHERA